MATREIARAWYMDEEVTALIVDAAKKCEYAIP